MKITASIAVSLLATYAAAETFNFFPTKALTCKTTTGSETVPVADLKSAARTGKSEQPYEASASNIGTTMQCSSQKLPFFYVRSAFHCEMRHEKVVVPRQLTTNFLSFVFQVGLKGELSMTFTYDKATDTYTMCGVDTGDVDENGYPDSCA